MTHQKTVAIIQGRMSSSRLPGKVLLDLGGKPMLGRVVERVRRARSLDLVLVATTTDPSDDLLVAYCLSRDYHVFRGDMFDVLDRYYQAAVISNAEVIVRITADCPVIDPGIIDFVIREYQRSGADLAANRLPPPWKRTFPIGLDVEVCSFAALERAWREADQVAQREHVMLYLYEGIPVDAFDLSKTSKETSPRGFHVLLVNHTPEYGSMRWTVDTPEDLALMQEIFARFKGRDDFSWTDILSLYKNEPKLARLNADVEHKSAFDVDSRRREDISKHKHSG